MMDSTQIDQTTIRTETPRTYIACLASFNAGHLHGAWIEADQDVEVIEAEIDAMLAASPAPHAEEWAVHAYDNFGPHLPDEYASLETISALARLLVHHGALASEVFGYTRNVEAAERMIDELYLGEFDDVADWAADYLDQTGGLEPLPEGLRCYFDFEAFGRDAELNGDILTFDVLGRVHVFSRG